MKITAEKEELITTIFIGKTMEKQYFILFYGKLRVFLVPAKLHLG
jgi:hypothetical protein